MNEEWKDIDGFKGKYQISNFGRVKSVERAVEYQGTNQTGLSFTIKKYCPEKIMKTYIYGRYEHIGLRKGKKTINYSIHRLVAEHFIDNPHNYPIINHKNENNLDNRATNLEWCTEQYNTNYGTRNERIAEKLKKNPLFYIPVSCYDLKNNHIKDYESAAQAGRELGIVPSGIIACCRQYLGRKVAGGYKWKYKESKVDISKTIYIPHKVTIHQFDSGGNHIATFKSYSEAAKSLGKNPQNFRNGIQKGYAFGYVWTIGEYPASINEVINSVFKKKHFIYQIDRNGTIVEKYKSTLEAEHKLGIDHSNICFAINSIRDGKHFRTAGGYYWVNVIKDPNYEIDFVTKKQN